MHPLRRCSIFPLAMQMAAPRAYSDNVPKVTLASHLDSFAIIALFRTCMIHTDPAIVFLYLIGT
jgi:hypothetical protein